MTGTGSDKSRCAAALTSADSLRRAKLFEDLLVERLERKCRQAEDVWESVARDWNQAFYLMFLRAMGAPRNSQPFETLGRRATFHMCMKERGRLRSVEALLLGTSGLLFEQYYDDYILSLQEDFRYLAAKYSLAAMLGGEWNTTRMLPSGGPIVRIAQAASVVSEERFCFDSAVACRTVEDVRRLFGAEVSDYWHAHFSPKGRSDHAPKRIGNQRLDTLAINLVVPMQFAYAKQTADEKLKAAALTLLESVPAESNRIVAGWTSGGVELASAADSQSLLQLESYCRTALCRKCPLAKQLKITTFDRL